jgi:ATP-GRASP peptide maturase of grasp-with-spasm system
MEWLLFKKQNFLRLNNLNKTKIQEIKVNQHSVNIKFRISNVSLDLKGIKTFWFRRGGISNDNFNIKLKSKELNWYLEQESLNTQTILINELDKKAVINKIGSSNPNKIAQLLVARKCRLNIPSTVITESKQTLKQFLLRNKKIITKSINTPFYFNDNYHSNRLLTSKYNNKDLLNTCSTFFLTKFQKEITKLYELRIVYLNGEFYAMAIFSQNNPKTRIDFRNYDAKKPNRNVPFLLPKIIKQRLKKLMKELDLNSGSIDMIVDEKKSYYFLEVNPLGQFGMVSYPCNYYLEEKFANMLCG